MKAVEMFKLNGYNLIREDDDYIIYSKKVNEYMDKIVSFCFQLENLSVLYESDFLRVDDVPSINMNLNKAIQAQLKELNWI